MEDVRDSTFRLHSLQVKPLMANMHRLLDKGVQIGIPNLNLDISWTLHPLSSILNNSIISNDSGGNIVVKSTLHLR